MITEGIVKQKIEDINNAVIPESSKYGKILNWQDWGIWHYGIGLSDDCIFDTGQNLQVFNSLKGLPVLCVDHIHFDRNTTIERLKLALDCFKDWDYSMMGWNCEHLARLVATDDPVSYSIKEILFGALQNSFDLVNGRHKIAKQVFNEYLELKAPNLVRK